jgi:hypothetical protein
MGWGGARQGAGRKPKPLSEKLAEGNPGKREIKVVKFDSQENQDEKPKLEKPAAKPGQIQVPAFLELNGHEGGGELPSAGAIYTMLTEFIKGSGCEKLIAPTLVEDFAHLRRAYLECEYVNRVKGRIANGKRSPYVGMAVDYQKQAMSVFDRIWNIIAQNSEQPYDGGKNEFLQLLMNRGF